MNCFSKSLIGLVLSLSISWAGDIAFATEKSAGAGQTNSLKPDLSHQSTQLDVASRTNQANQVDSQDISIDTNDPLTLASAGNFTKPEDLQKDEMFIKHPQLKALISVDSDLDPYSLDAQNTRLVGLRDVLSAVTDRNLDIGISKLSEGIGKYDYLGSLGKFLPDFLFSYNYQYLKGKANVPFGGSGPMTMDNPFIITSAGFRYYGYRGGGTLFGALRNRHLYRAAIQSSKATISDALLETTRRYYDLVLNEVVLQIRIRAVEVSKAQLKLNQDLLAAGSTNRLDVFQAETQLSQDRQNLIDQQIARRKSAIELAELLNLDQSLDLVPAEPSLRTRRLVGEHVHATELLSLAIANRPELKEVEQQRLAAKQAVAVAAAPLQPTVALNGTAYGIGQTLSNSSETVIAPITMATAQGPVTSYTSQRVSKQITNLNSLGLTVNWNLEGLGTTALAKVQSARLGARQASLRSTEELNKVSRQVRESYLNELSAQQKMLETASHVRSASEELRLARLRFENGLAKNIDVLRAQQDYTDAVIDKSRALVSFNLAQAQLLHDIGLISVDALTETVAAVPNNRG